MGMSDWRMSTAKKEKRLLGKFREDIHITDGDALQKIEVAGCSVVISHRTLEHMLDIECESLDSYVRDCR